VFLSPFRQLRIQEFRFINFGGWHSGQHSDVGSCCFVIIRQAMNRRWTPECRVSITDAGMVIEIELGDIRAGYPAITFEDGQLCIRGQHENFGPFECRFNVPPNHSLTDAKATMLKGVLRIELPQGKEESASKPRSMIIYCNGCGKHFDILIARKGPQNYSCPACGKAQVFDLEDFVRKAIEQSQKMANKRRGRR
jgi:HSP20 family molecular chaperone IbpA